MTQLIANIIDGLLCPDSERINVATNQLFEAYKQPDILWNLCQIITSTRIPEVRQMAGVLLEKRLHDNGVWQMLSPEQQAGIKQYLMQAMITEKTRTVRKAIGRVVGTVVRHLGETKDQWICDVMKFIYERCASVDPMDSEMGSFTFLAVADSDTCQFKDQMLNVCQLFETVLINAVAQNSLISETVSNMCLGIVYLIPFLGNDPKATEKMTNSMPLIMKVIHEYALHGDKNCFINIFEILNCIAEYAPKVFQDVAALVSFSMNLATNEQIEKSTRVQLLMFAGALVRAKKTDIIQQNLLEPIVNVLWEAMCMPPDDDDMDESSLPDTGSQILDDIAMTVSPEKLMPPILRLIEPALQSPDHCRRRAAYLVMGTITEGCPKIICNLYLESMLRIIKQGTEDPVLDVRSAALFAIGEFLENLQPDVVKFAPEILCLLIQFLRQLLMEMKMGAPEPEHMADLFEAFEKCCGSLEQNIAAQLPMVMECLYETLDSNYPINLRTYGLWVVAGIANTNKGLMLPYFSRVMAAVQEYLVKDCDPSFDKLRAQAIHTWSSIIRNVGPEAAAPYSNNSMCYCLMMLAEGPDDPEVRFSIYNLFGALSNVYKENMAGYLPKVMDRIVLSVISHNSILTVPKDIKDGGGGGDNTDDDDDDDDFDDIVENDFMVEKEEAIYCLKELANTTGNAFAPYLEAAFKNVFKVIRHPMRGIRKASIEALCEFVKAFHRLGNLEAVEHTSKILVRKFYSMIEEDPERFVVINVLDETIDLLGDLQAAALPLPSCVKLMFKASRNVMAEKTKCQSAEGQQDNETAVEGSKLDEKLIELAALLFTELGYATEPPQYVVFFDKGLVILSKILKRAFDNNIGARKSLVYNTLSYAIKHLGPQVVTYFDSLFPIFMNGTRDTEAKARKPCYYGLGELLAYGEHKSPEAWPVILQRICEATTKETEPAVLDRICGALARLVVTNRKDVQSEQIFSALINHMPLREEYDDTEAILQAFEYVYVKAGVESLNYIEKIMALTIEILQKNQITDKIIVSITIRFIKLMCEEHPEKFRSICTASPDVYNFVMSL